jgi:tetraprenyl-beta-curcumene synthase
VMRAVVTYQTAFDYLDLLAEQPSADQIGNGRRLHRALLAATDPCAGHVDYYARQPRHADAGYLRAMVDACRAALGALPAHGLVLAPLRRASARIAAYQSYNHGDAAGSHRAFEAWGRSAAGAHRVRHPGDGLSWWELSAAAGSSMPVFALLAAAAEPGLTAPDVAAIERVYHPRIGALNSLLDSLVDRHEDRALRQNELLGHYADIPHAIARLRAIAADALRDTHELPRAGGHPLILTAMVCYYLHELGDAITPSQRAALAGAVGGLAGPTLLVFRARAAVARLRR